ncbi:FG-GAP-like repeat-containing protein [Streptomyces sp. L2]|uniref:FG-GAP-like repeat-containing protein n=1 Tax=Streptomyces sp. L2 TaxID=2162665 RepID=UPI001F50A8CB|nr:FG-GAP-like repeat-containing protein [Streptomyces sp. L2]
MTVNKPHLRGSRRAGALVAAVALGIPLLSATPAAAVHGAVPGDFNGDGYRDAVLPAPGAKVAGKQFAGAVVVLYGSKSGLSTARRQTITQNTAGVPGSAEAFDQFGAATATADLNRDGYADLVVTAPYEDTASRKDAGLLTVLWGGKNGLTAGALLPNPSPYGDYYGTDVAAVSSGAGANTEILVSGQDGAVTLTGPFGRTGTVGQASVVNTSTPSIGTVALGDFNGDTRPDGVSLSVRVSGLTGGQVYLGGAGPGGELRKGNGLIAATGDVNGDGFQDLVVGDPDDPEKAGVDGAAGGRVLVWYGSERGIAHDDVPVQLTQNTAGVPGSSEKDDNFGGALAVADLNRDGLADIVVGSPYEDTGKDATDAGMVTVIPGRRTGALGSGSYAFTQDTPGVPGGGEAGDNFGTTVAVGDVNGDGKPELFISAAAENGYTGAVWVLPGGTSGPVTKGSHMIDAPSVGFTQEGWTALGGNGLLHVI